MSGIDHGHNRAGEWSGSALRWVLSVVMLLVVSCIDGDEEYWIQSDGSGRAEITYKLPATLVATYGGDASIRKMIVDFLEKTPAITASACEVVTEEKTTTIRVSTDFDSALDLAKIPAGKDFESLPAAVSHLVGEIKLDLHGRTVDFKRTAFPGKAFPGSFLMPASTFEGHRLVYTLHLPASAGDSNATRTEDGGRTLIWDNPLKKALESPLVSRFSMVIPIPWAAVSVAAVLVILMAGCLIIFIWRKFSRRQDFILNAGEI